MLVFDYGGLKITGSIKNGEHCCKDCSKGANPKPYSVISGEVGGNAAITVVAAGIAKKFTPKWFGSVVAEGRIILAPLPAKGTFALSAKGESGEISECKESKCNEISISAGVNIAIGSLAELSGSLKYCDDVGNPNSCETELLSVKGETEATGNFNCQVKGNTFLGDDCPDGDAFFVAGKISLLAKVKVSATVFGIYDVEGEIKEEVVFYDGNTSD